jgi:putative ABC transport system permease protein
VGLVRTIVRLAPETFPGITSVAINPSVLLFAVAATLAATVLAGLLPAIRLGRVDATASLAGGTRGAAGHVGRLTPLLVGGQVALAVIVAVGSGLMLRSLETLLSVDPGIDGNGVIAFRPNPPTGRYADGAAFDQFYDQVIERVRAIPGIESAGAIHLLPGTNANWSFPTFPEGYAVTEGAGSPNVNFRAVRGDYFETVRVPIIAGRAPADADRTDSEPVVAVNEAFVARFWPDQDPMGRTLGIFSASGTRYRVVGVVADVHQHGRDVAPLAEMYFSHGQVPWDQMWMWVVARVRTGEPMDAARAVQEAVWALDPDVPVSGIADLAEVLGQSTRTTRFLAVLLSSFGALAVGLAGVGVFGVTTYTSGRRRPEFGVRLALGSSRSEVVRSAALRSLAPVAVGLVVGLVVATATSTLLSSVLFGVEPSDPVTFAGVALLLGSVGVLAAVVPAWRVSRVDPVTVLASD